MKAAKFLSNYLKADLLENRAPSKLTIRIVKEEAVGIGDQQQKKMVLYFKEIEQGLVLNKTNAKVLVKNFGDETDAWVGKVVEMYVAEVEFQGEPQLGIRLRMP